MEITTELLKSLSSEDLKRIEVYKKLLAEAEEAVETIIGTYKFDIFQEKVVIRNDGNNAEYLTHSGVWQARYLNQRYDVSITVENIFDIYKECYEHNLKNTGRVNTKADSAVYFRFFVRKCKDRMTKGVVSDNG